MLYYLANKIRNAKAAALAARATPPNPMDCRRPPKFGPSLPYKMGAGGWPVEEPTQEALNHFLKLLDKVPYTYFGPYEPDSADYGTQYTDVIEVKQWLKLIKDSKLLARDTRYSK